MLRSSHDLPVVRAANAVMVSTNHPPQAHLPADHAIHPAPNVLAEMVKLNAQLATLVINFSKMVVASNALVFALIAMILVSTVPLVVPTLIWPQLPVQRPMNTLVFAMINSGLRIKIP